jgi:ParB family transcriptional regulator, chromosome partitioning protein
MAKYMDLLIETVDVDPVQAARHHGSEGLRRLTDNVARYGILQPIGVKPWEPGLWRVVFGNCRTLAAMAAGLKTVPANILDEKILEGGVGAIQLIENMLRTDLTGYQQWQGCVEALKQNPHWTNKELSERLSIDQSTVTRIMSPSKCITAWQEALKAGTVGISDCYAASKIEVGEQDALLALKLSGASRDQLEKAGRKARTTTPTAAKLARVRCPLPGGTTVVVSGPAMTLDGYIETLQTALELAKRSHKDSLDVRTAERVWKDKNKSR